MSDILSRRLALLGGAATLRVDGLHGNVRQPVRGGAPGRLGSRPLSVRSRVIAAASVLWSCIVAVAVVGRLAEGHRRSSGRWAVIAMRHARRREV